MNWRSLKRLEFEWGSLSDFDWTIGKIYLLPFICLNRYGRHYGGPPKDTRISIGWLNWLVSIVWLGKWPMSSFKRPDLILIDDLENTSEFHKVELGKIPSRIIRETENLFKKTLEENLNIADKQFWKEHEEWLERCRKENDGQ